MPEPKRKTTSKQVMDVHNADNVAADENSKPVIVANRQILRDPMVTSEATTPVVETKSAPAMPADTEAPVATAEIPAIDPQSDEPVAAASEVEPAEMKHQKIIAPVTFEPKTAAAPEATPPEEAPAAEEAEPADDQPVPTAETTDEAIEAAAEEAKVAREAELQKLVDKKQFYLPINAIEQRRAEQFIALGILLSVILALAWLDISLDAGLIHLGNVHAVTHFFSN